MALEPLANAGDEKRDRDKGGSLSSRNATLGDSQAPEGTIKEPLSSPPESDYPTGWKLACIVLALILGIFLASLDMVLPPSHLALRQQSDHLQLDLADNRGNSYPQNH
jgi:hypothetical protein